MSKINVYINVAVMGNVNDVLARIMGRIRNSGLYGVCDAIYMVINGDIDIIDLDLSQEKYVVVNGFNDVSRCEFPTLDLIWQHAGEDDFNVLYLHSKGVTRPGLLPVADWTDYLTYFNVDRWRERVEDLALYDCSGVNLTGDHDNLKLDPQTWNLGNSPKCYSGNFWWSSSSHIRKLPNPYDWMPDDNFLRWRHMCEMWLCQLAEGKYFCAYRSNINHYTDRYPKELYESPMA